MRILLLAVLAIQTLRGTTIVNGGTLLNQTNANQLATWLGEGDLTLNNIFGSGPAAGGGVAFHAAADNVGRTFLVIQTDQGLVGGYNPANWNVSLGGYVTSPTDATRTAFIFSLSSVVKLAQRLTSQQSGVDTGYYQTMDSSSYGPVFGGGFDLAVTGNLAQALVYSWSYGNGFGGTNVLGSVSTSGFVTANVTRVEAYTIANSAATPEPGTAGLLVGGCGLLAVGRRRRRG